MYANNQTIGIIGISHTYRSIINALTTYNYKIIICDIDKNKLKNEPYESYTDYKTLTNKIDIAFIATPPSTHYELANYFLERDIKVICEKPLVTNLVDLTNLSKYNDLYNVLHFSFGEEIDYFINNFDRTSLPEKIICTINDPYIENNKIKEEKLSLHGSYLDEAINPLSAIERIYQKDLKFIRCKKYFYQNDPYDYKSSSIFKMENTTIKINTYWNNEENKEKYIDLFFKDKTIRLDSINKKVIDLTNNQILFKSSKERMDMHYLNALKNITPNEETFYILNKVILEGEQNAENYIY